MRSSFILLRANEISEKISFFTEYCIFMLPHFAKVSSIIIRENVSVSGEHLIQPIFLDQKLLKYDGYSLIDDVLPTLIRRSI